MNNLTATQLAQARQASASVLGRFSGAEQFDVRTQSFAAPSSIQYRPFNLNRPLESILISMRFRVAVTVGAYADVSVEAPQNILQRIRLEGQHRTHGNMTLLNLSGASAFADAMLVQQDAGNYSLISVGGGALTRGARPGQPFTSPFTGAVANHDVMLFWNIPVTPQMGIGSDLKRWANAFLLMPNDWQDTLQLTLDIGDATALGDTTGATVAFTSFGAATGSPEVSVHLCYSLLGPFQNSAVSGITLRTERLLTTFTALAAQQRLLSLDKRITTGIRVKTGLIEDTGQTAGVSTFDTLSSVMLDQTQVMVDNKPVRNVVDDLIEKSRINRMFNVAPIEGYHLISFVDGQNPLLGYRGDGLPGGSQFDLISSILTASANNRIAVLQEQIIGGPFPPLRP